MYTINETENGTREIERMVQNFKVSSWVSASLHLSRSKTGKRIFRLFAQAFFLQDGDQRSSE